MKMLSGVRMKVFLFFKRLKASQTRKTNEVELTPRWKVLFPSINWQLLRGNDHFLDSEVLEDLRAKSVIFCFFKEKKTLHNLFHG